MIRSATSLSVSRDGGAVADGDQLDVVLGGRARPAASSEPSQSLRRLVRVDGGGVEHLAGGVDHRHLEPVRRPGSRPMDARCRPARRAAGRAGSRRRRGSPRLRRARAARPSVRVRGACRLARARSSATVSSSHLSAGRPGPDAEARGDRGFARIARPSASASSLDCRAQETSACLRCAPRSSASTRCEGCLRAVPSSRSSRGIWRPRLPCRRRPCDSDHAVLLQVLAQLAEQVGVFGEALHRGSGARRRAPPSRRHAWPRR